jgi:hypothetical protein
MFGLTPDALYKHLKTMFFFPSRSTQKVRRTGKCDRLMGTSSDDDDFTDSGDKHRPSRAVPTEEIRTATRSVSYANFGTDDSASGPDPENEKKAMEWPD